jgi:cobalt-zinc-cadmium efflux system membrane fusion protein
MIAGVLIACAPVGACSRAEAESSPGAEAHQDHEGHDHGEEGAAHDEAGHDEHDEGAGDEGDDLGHSDLDRRPEELFAASCEHGIKTHECDECRYEVGVVKADESLFEGGLLTKGRAEKRRLEVPLKLTGEVQFDERRVAHVSSQAEGVIRKVDVNLGDQVKRGQALVQISSVMIGEAQASLVAAESVLELAKRNHDRVQTLRQENIASERELLGAQQELEVARIRVRAERNKLRTLGAGSQGGIVLRAPMDGTVLQLHAVAGEVARAEESLGTIGDNGGVWVWADLYERDLALVKHAQAKKALAATVEVKGYPGQEFQGVVDFVSPSMSEASRTVKLRIAVPNPKGELLAGMFAQVNVFIPGDEEVLAIPSQAVVEDEGRVFVFVHHHEDYYLRRPVKVGRAFSGFVEVSEGLSGDKVVVANGAFLMKSDVLRSKMGAGCAD